MKRNTIPKNKIIVPPGFKLTKNPKKNTFVFALICLKCGAIHRYYGSAKPPKKFKCPLCKIRKKKPVKTKKVKPIKIRRGKK